jgi:hypothetical protein
MADIGTFMDECTRRKPHLIVSVDNLYSRYVLWCIQRERDREPYPVFKYRIQQLCGGYLATNAGVATIVGVEIVGDE